MLGHKTQKEKERFCHKAAKKNARKKEPVAFNPPGASRQVQFYQLLVGARKQWLMDALSETLAEPRG